MKTAFKSALLAVLATLLFTSCTTPAIWPKPEPYTYLYYLPQKTAADEAMETIRSLNQDLYDFDEVAKVHSLSVDPDQLEAHCETARIESRPRVMSNGQLLMMPKLSLETFRTSLIIPFNEITDVALINKPSALLMPYDWGMFVFLQNNKRVRIGVTSEFSLKELSDAVVTLAIERGVQFHQLLLGSVTEPLTPEQSQKMGIEPGTGRLVTGVCKNSPAEQAGIRFLDVLMEFDGVPLATTPDICSAIRNATSSGKTTVPVKLLRLEQVSQEIIDPNTNKVQKTEMVEKSVELTVQVSFAP